MPILVALLLAAHGLVHGCFVVPRPPTTPGGPAWPFDLSRSWALTPLGVGPSATRAIGVVLLVIVVAGFLVAAAVVLGPLPASLFVPGVVAGSVGSIALLGLFFHPWLVLGVAIDAVLLWAVLANAWRPGGAGG